MIRRLKMDVLSELPPKKRKEVYISVNSDSIKEMEEFKQRNKLKQSMNRLLMKKDRYTVFHN